MHVETSNTFDVIIAGAGPAARARRYISRATVFASCSSNKKNSHAPNCAAEFISPECRAPL
jgi:hypothetical protein